MVRTAIRSAIVHTDVDEYESASSIAASALSPGSSAGPLANS